VKLKKNLVPELLVQYKRVPLLSMAPAAGVANVDPEGINIGAAKVVPAAKVKPFPTAKFVMDVWPVPPREAGKTPALATLQIVPNKRPT